MKRLLALGLAGALVVLAGCADGSLPTDVDAELVFEPGFDMTTPPDGGACPNVYYETTDTLPNGAIVTWRSAFGGFEYDLTNPAYTVNEIWTVTGGPTVTAADLGTRKNSKNTWTPRSKNDPANGTFSIANVGTTSLDLTVNFSEMHQGDEDIDGDGVLDWIGEIGNGHFHLVLDFDDGTQAKFGVNVHAEDPDPASPIPSRCIDPA